MPPLRTALVSSLVIAADARRLRRPAAAAAGTPAAVATAADGPDPGRRLQTCWDGTVPDPMWHPNYAAGWTAGYCIYASDCDAATPSFATQLACCQGAYAGQLSGHCLSMLPSPPTVAPTPSGGLEVYYPLYEAAGGWPAGHCTNARPLPAGRPTYATMLACCNEAYAGQTSGTCLSKLPNPPTASPTVTGATADFWYPDYGSDWANAGCLNALPLPFTSGSRPTYDTQLACCKGAYAGQTSGACLGLLPNPPTASPTGSGGADFWYPEYEKAYGDAGCSNALPLPFPAGGRVTYDTQLSCCKSAYADQASGKCLSQLPNPPTSSPTKAGGADFWYPDYDTAYDRAGCSNALPLPFTDGSRPTYDTQLACCKAAYAGQASGACLNELPNPPTSSPTKAGGADFWYPEYEKAYDQAGCSNTLPLPFTDGSRPTYDTQLACCKAAYAGQASGVCLSLLPNPPTSSPTKAGGADFWYPEYEKAYDQAGCSNTLPLPFTDGSRATYDTQLACCKAAYAGQASGMCLSLLPNPPTSSPTKAGGADFWYPEYEKPYAEAGCSNDLPLPFTDGSRPTYDTQLACCKSAYAGQASGVCLNQLPNPPTSSPTKAGGADFWYPDYGTAYSEAGCSNALPLPFTDGSRPTYDTQLACCKAAYAGQLSGACLNQLPNPPTSSPTKAGGADFWYPDYDTAYDQAGCSNDLPLPFTDGSRPTYDSQLACCKAAYAGQSSGACLNQLPNPPTASPTSAGGADFWYPDYETDYAQAGCTNALPLPFTAGGRTTYDTQLACCKGAYLGQASGACLSQLPSPPTSSPTGVLFYPSQVSDYSAGTCISDRPLPIGRPTYSSKVACCSAQYGSQSSDACMCDAVGLCHSCNCHSGPTRNTTLAECPDLAGTC